MTTRPALQEMLKTTLQGNQGAPTAPLSRVRDEASLEVDTGCHRSRFCNLGCSCTLPSVHDLRDECI